MRSMLQPEVELMVFLRMRSKTTQEKRQKHHKMQVEGQSSHEYIFFGTRNSNLRSTLKPEVELMVFLRMRSNKNMKILGKCHSFKA